MYLVVSCRFGNFACFALVIQSQYYIELIILSILTQSPVYIRVASRNRWMYFSLSFQSEFSSSVSVYCSEKQHVKSIKVYTAKIVQRMKYPHANNECILIKIIGITTKISSYLLPWMNTRSWMTSKGWITTKSWIIPNQDLPLSHERPPDLEVMKDLVMNDH